MKKVISKFLALVAALAVIIGLGGSMTVTRENEYKLIREFGRVSRVIDQAGLSFRIPFIQTADSLPKALCSSI